MVQVKCRHGCGKVISVPAALFEEFSQLRHAVCGCWTGLDYQVHGEMPGCWLTQ